MPVDRSRPAGPTRSLWLTALWTGLGTVLIGAMAAIAVVAVVWLPASGASGSAGSAIRAGILTFLASLHGGITVDGVPAALLPLGLTVITGYLAWRAGGMLADTAEDLVEVDPRRLVQAGLVQAGAFALACAILAAAGSLGTSHVSPVAAFLAALVLFLLTGGTAHVRRCALRDELTAVLPEWATPVTRSIVTVVAVQLSAGALLLVGAVVVHHDRVSALSSQVGGGWSGIPVLLLGVLAAPNAVIAGAGYLSGAGFAVGSATSVGLTSTTHGTLPAFPVLGALPDGTSATLPVWVLAVLTPLIAGSLVAASARRAATVADSWREIALTVVGAGLLGAVLAWQGGGAIGSGALSAVGASPWQFALATAVGIGVVASAVLATASALAARPARDDAGAGQLRATLTAVRSAVAAGRAVDADDEFDNDEVDNDEVEDDEFDDDELEGVDDHDTAVIPTTDGSDPGRGGKLAG